MNDHIILPLDGLTCSEAIDVINSTHDIVWGYKVRKQIIDEGKDFISEADNMMVDFKLYDIPSAMEEAATEFVEAGAKIVTVHCSAEWCPPNGTMADKIAGVTVLTSFDAAPNYFGQGIMDTVRYFTDAIVEPYGYGYMVCSAKDLELLPDTHALKITPGIRPLWYQKEDDQSRTMTPSEAIKAGADLLVIGRPLLNAPNVRDAIKKTNDEIEKALEEI